MSAPSLNAEQRRAVEHGEGPMLVLAGPGTGKTSVLVSRVARLVESGVGPERVLALTFSRRAADELRERVSRQLPAASGVDARTFHSFALSVVRRNHGALGIPRPPEILPTAEQWTIVSELLADEDPAEWNLPPNAFEREATVREVYDLLLRAREYLISPESLRRLGEDTGTPHLLRAGYVLEKFQSRLAGRALLDYEGVVRHALRLLEDESPARTELTGRYDHILVDEFQDTNRSQLELVRRLAPGDNPNVFCVGDDAQSIYGFRGARVENVSKFEAHFPGAERVQLRDNYRCASGIVSLAEAAIRAGDSHGGRERQRVASPKPGAVLYTVSGSPASEAEWISDRIVELNRTDGVPFDRIAILRRSLLDSAPLVDALASRGIPADLPDRARGTAARRLSTLLAATAGTEPGPVAASSALTTPLAGVDPETARALRTSAEYSGRSVFELLSSGDSVGGVPEEGMRRARAVVEAVRFAAGEEDFLRKVDALWKRLPGARELFERHEGDPRSARDLMEALAFLRSARSYAAASAAPTVEGFLRAGAMAHDDADTWEPSAPPAEGAVKVLTVHASKGLEFEAVFVSGLNEGNFPARSRGARLVDHGMLSDGRATPRAELERRGREEERRLLYVSLTRARTHLYLSGVEETAEDGSKASPFLRELEEDLVELAANGGARKFWTSREEAVEELRRAAGDSAAPDYDRFAAARTLAGMGEEPRSWWRYAESTPDSPPRSGPLELDSGEAVAHLGCPRRAFMRRLAGSGGGAAGRMLFGAAFKEGLRRYLRGEIESLETAAVAALGEREFGGAAIAEFWRRRAVEAASSCEGWAAGLRESLISAGGEYEIEVGEHRLSGRHDIIIEDENGRTLVRVSTSRSAAPKADAASDPDLALAALGSGADRARLEYPRYFAYGGPAKRPLDTAEGWREAWRERLEGAFSEVEAGAFPPRPASESLCERCEFKVTCPLHAGEEPWLR